MSSGESAMRRALRTLAALPDDAGFGPVLDEPGRIGTVAEFRARLSDGRSLPEEVALLSYAIGIRHQRTARCAE